MAGPSLSVDWQRVDHELARLVSLLPSIPTLPAAHRKLVAEIMMVRLFLLVENTIQSVCGKLLCNCNYLDGSTPRRLVTARSLSMAFDLMRTHGRVLPKRFLGWNQSADIRDNLSNALDAADPAYLVVTANAALLTHMRYMRNHIAHKNEGTRRNFHKVMRSHYGAIRRGITSGTLLLTVFAPGAPSLIAQYLTASRVFLKLLVRV
jgi:hypothetical protein